MRLKDFIAATEADLESFERWANQNATLEHRSREEWHEIFSAWGCLANAGRTKLDEMRRNGGHKAKQ